MESSKNDPPIPSIKGDPEIHGIILDKFEYDGKLFGMGPFKPIGGRMPSARYDNTFVSFDVEVKRTNPIYTKTIVYLYDSKAGGWQVAEIRRSRITMSEIPGIVQLYRAEHVKPESPPAPFVEAVEKILAEVEKPKVSTPPWVDPMEQQEEDDGIPF